MIYAFDELTFLIFSDPGRPDGDFGVGGGAAAQVSPDGRRVDQLLRLGRRHHSAALALAKHG